MSVAPKDIIDELGQRVDLGLMLGQGGEGAVWEVPGKPGLVAKIYHEPLKSDRANKIRAMTKLKTEQLDKLTAWPVQLLLKKPGIPIGLLMPKVAGHKDIHHLYSPKSRRADFPSADWRFLIRTSANVSRAFAAVHSTGSVIGDVNHGSVLVSENATVKLIDCDSFQITHDGRRFYCEVGVETFTPPELQGKSFNGVIRTFNHDNFGLAVLIFQMLFMGRHPFAGRYSGPGDMPISKAIAEIRFPYGKQRQSVGMLPPPGTPPLSIVGHHAADLFEKAFAKETTVGGRPSPLDWSVVLSDLEKNLQQCRSNSAHWHHTGQSCPWCPMEGATGVALFGIATVAGTFIGADVASVWRQIEAIRDPGPAPNITVGAAVATPEANAAAKAAAKASAIRVIMVALTTLAVVGLTLNFAAGFWWIFGPAAGFSAWKLFSREVETSRFKDEASAAIQHWRALDDMWQERASNRSFQTKKLELAKLKSEWDGLPAKKAAKLAQLQRNLRQHQLEAFLDRFEIAKAKIESIGPGRKQTLESYGISTALDVTEPSLAKVPGFGPKTNAKLLHWRAGIEAKFVFKANAPIDPRLIKSVDAEISKRKGELEAALRKGLNELQQIANNVTSARETMKGAMLAAAAAKAQAEANLAVIGG